MVSMKNIPTVHQIIHSDTFTETQLNALSVSHTVTQKDGTTTSVVISGSLMLKALDFKYGTFNFVHATDIMSFVDVFSTFKLINEYSINKIIDALYMDYNPIENYDRDETTTATANKDGAKLTSTTYQTADDSSTFYGRDKAETTQDKPVVNETVAKVHGNIGVTTSQQMIVSELSLRATNNAVYNIIDMFANSEII